jgi:hypothetical protein
MESRSSKTDTLGSAKGIPKWLKIAFTAWMLVWIPAYMSFYGPQNFLWLCDLCNFIVLIALLTESSLLFSSQMVAVLIVDIIWGIDVTGALLSGVHLIGGTEYMFNPGIPILIRLLSLFHVFIPAIIVFGVIRLGYHKRGLILQTLLTWVILPLTYLLTSPEMDINWVWGLFGKPQSTLAPWFYFLLCMAGYPLVLYIPTHGLVTLICRWRGRQPCN